MIRWENYIDDPKIKAKSLAKYGRGGDTMLMHVTPQEVELARSVGGITTNPDTGLPEAFLFLPALLAGIASAASAVGSVAAPVIGAIGSGLGAIGSGIGSAAGLLSGVTGIGGGGAAGAGAGAAGAGAAGTGAGITGSTIPAMGFTGSAPAIGTGGFTGAQMVGTAAPQMFINPAAGAGVYAPGGVTAAAGAPIVSSSGIGPGIGTLANAAIPGASVIPAANVASSASGLSKVGSGLAKAGKGFAGFVEKHPSASLFGLYGLGSVIDSATKDKPVGRKEEPISADGKERAQWDIEARFPEAGEAGTPYSGWQYFRRTR